MGKWEIAGLYRQTAQNQTDPTLQTADAYIKRLYAIMKNGQKFKLYVPIMCGLAQQGKLIPNLIDMKFIFTKTSNNDFHYTCPETIADTFRLSIEAAHLAIKRVKLYPTVEQEIVSRLNEGTICNMYFRHEYCRAFSLRVGETTVRHPNILLTDYLPRSMLVCLIERAEYDGSKSASNFSFQPQGLESLCVTSNGITYPVDGPFEPEFTGTVATSQYGRSYFSLTASAPGLGLKSDFAYWINQQMWATGFAIYKFDFSRYNQSFVTGDAYLDQRIPSSGCDLHFKFKNALTEALVALVFTSYVESISISSDSNNTRNVELNYAL